MSCLLAACQNYDFVYQPNTDRRGVHLQFAVQQPSRADILFVIDNSGSMGPRQAALKNSLDEMLRELAPKSTSYRIGIVSTDTVGWWEDCHNEPLTANPLVDPNLLPGARGNCSRPDVALRWPHDGARGRLIAAYDAHEFDPDAADNLTLRGFLATPEQRAAFLALRPTGPASGPTGSDGLAGVRWVIDRDFVQEDACRACAVSAAATSCASSAGKPPDCSRGSRCFEECAGPVATALVSATFRSNVNGLGIDGSGYEMGLLSAMQAVGIDPEQSDDLVAVLPPADLTRAGEPNSYSVTEGGVRPLGGSWLRADALLAIMVVSDEQDCSMPSSVYEIDRSSYEERANPVQPLSSICYQHGQNGLPDPAGTLFFDPDRLAQLVTSKKGGAARVAAGFVGALRQVGPSEHPDRDAEAADCVSTDRAPLQVDGQPSSTCSCSFSSIPEDGDRWCDFTQNTSPPSAGLLACDGFAGSRYTQFASHFRRRTFDSICRSGEICNTVSDCLSGRSCISNECVVTCAADRECDAGAHCDHGVCVRGCRSSADCGSGRTCANGACVSGFGLALGRFADVTALNCFELAESLRPLNSDSRNIVVKWKPHDKADDGSPMILLNEVKADSTDPGWTYEAADNSVCLRGIDREIGDVFDIFIVTRDTVLPDPGL